MAIMEFAGFRRPMLHNIKHLYGRVIHALDGEIGSVSDFYFDDSNWSVRYVVVQAGAWLAGRQILLSRENFARGALGAPGSNENGITIDRSRREIEAGPSIDSRRSVSRQHEVAYHRHLGSPLLSGNEGMEHAAGLVSTELLVDQNPSRSAENRGMDDPHLRSAKAVKGYRVQATDDSVGSLTSLLIDGDSWAVRELVVRTGFWHGGKMILILPERIVRISFDDAAVFANLTRADVLLTAGKETTAPPGRRNRVPDYS